MFRSTEYILDDIIEAINILCSIENIQALESFFRGLCGDKELRSSVETLVGAFVPVYKAQQTLLPGLDRDADTEVESHKGGLISPSAIFGEYPDIEQKLFRLCGRIIRENVSTVRYQQVYSC